MRRLAIPHLSIVGFILAGAVLGVVGWHSYRQLQKARNTEARVLQTLEVRALIHNLNVLIDDAETSQRGFLITDDPSYLRPYENAVRLLPEQANVLEKLTQEDSRQQEYLVQLQQLIAVKLQELAKTIQARKAGGFGPASEMVRTNQGQRIMDRIQAVLGAMIEEESRVYHQRQELSARDARTSVTLALGGLSCALALVLGSGLLLADQYRRQEEAQEALRASEQSLRQRSAQILRVQEEERQRLGRELHDNAGQYLVMLKMRLDSLVSSSGPREGERQKLTECVNLANETIKEVRATSYELYPPMLEQVGLGSAIPWFVEGFMGRGGIKTTLAIPGDFDRLPRDVELALFRVLQESLTNVRRHSGSPAAHVRVERWDGTVRLEVADEGKGIPSDVLQAIKRESLEKLGVGLRGMKARIRDLGGNLEVFSNGGGTTVRATVPVGKA